MPVATHRAIESLQVAVDDERKIIESLACSERQCADRLGFVHFTVAENTPNVTLVGFRETAVLEVTHKAGLIDRVDRPDSHGACRELPEIRHQPRVGIRAKTFAGGLLAIVCELLLAEAAFEERSCIDAGCGVRLKKYEVRSAGCVRSAEEMIKARLKDLSRRCVGCDMTTQFAVSFIGAYHHG